MMNKRDFLASAASALVAPSAFALGNPATAAHPVMNMQDWQAHLNQDFVLLDCPGQPRITLSAITPLASTDTEQFHLSFTGPGASLPSGTYLVAFADAPRRQTALLYLAESGHREQPRLRADFNLL